MSPSTSRTGPRAMALAMLSIRPRTRLSTTTISRNSRRTRRSTIVEPTRPAPPVTSTRLPSRLTDPPTPRSLPPAHPPDDDFRQDVAEQLHPITGCPVGPESLQNVQPRPAGDTRGACSPAAVERTGATRSPPILTRQRRTVEECPRRLGTVRSARADTG